MPAKKKSVTTPLHLLQQLSHSLIEHLDKACSQAIKDAEGALAKLQKQRGKAQDKLTKARAKLDEAGSTGKPKAQTKARARLGELEESLTLLQTRQSETLNYLAELKRDAEHSLKLAQGIRQVADAADQALQGRQQPAKPAAARPAAGKSAPAAAKPRASTTRASAAKADSAPAKAGTTTTASKPAAKPAAKSPAKAAAKPAAAPASAAAKPATTGRAPARRRPVHVRLPVRRHPCRRRKACRVGRGAGQGGSCQACNQGHSQEAGGAQASGQARRRSASSQLQLSLQRRAAQDFQRGAVVRYRDEGFQPGVGSAVRRPILADLLQPFEQFALGLQFQRFQRFTQAV